MTLLELFRFLVPYFASTQDEDVQQALEFAAAYRPACLTQADQDVAQVWYAAAVLYGRQQQAATGGTSPIPIGVKSEKEGDLQRTYGLADGAADPFGYLGKYNDLARICGGLGAITVGHRYAPCCC